ncbi:efflux RND transporter periplasmic adaptor subunit [Arenibacterium sp. CAU 1754]
MHLKARTVFFVGLSALVFATLAFVAFRTDPIPVDLYEIGHGPMQVTINADGKTRISEVYEVAAPITGIAQRSPVRVGDPVLADETVVAVVEPASSNLLDARTRIQAEAAVREAESALYVARSQMRQVEEELAYAESQYTRVKSLVERGVTAQTQLEDATQLLGIKRAAETAAISNLEMTKSALDRARAALIEPSVDRDAGGESCCVQIKAPVDGQVLDIDMISERPVMAGARLLSIGQPNDLEIVADLLSSDAVRLSPGARATVERWGGSELLEARVSKIEPAAYTKVSALGIEEQRVDVVFELITPVEERAELGDGFSVFLRIVEWESDDVTMVPLSAVFRTGNAWAVFVAEGDLARLRQIELGRRNSTDAQVLSGLTVGDKVITHPSENIRDGSKIVERGTE